MSQMSVGRNTSSACPSIPLSTRAHRAARIGLIAALLVVPIRSAFADDPPPPAQTPDPWMSDNPIGTTFDPNGPLDNDGLAKDPGEPGAPPLADPHAPVPGTPIPEGDDAMPRGGPVPANDTCGNATVIPAAVVTYNPALLDTTGATTSLCDAGESCEKNNAGVSNSVWYSYTPALSGSVNINTFGSNYDTVLSVFDGCGTGLFPNCNPPNQLACNDDAFPGPPFNNIQSQVSMNIVAGHTYKIKVSDYDSADGGGLLNFNLTWYPPNDLCENATPITGISFNPPTYSTTTADTELCESQESCELNNVGVSNTVFYSFTPPCNGLISVNTNGSSYDTVLSIWDGCGQWVDVDVPCITASQIACDDDSGTGLNSQLVNIAVTAGMQYIIKVADYNTTAGGGTLDFNFMFSGASPPVAQITSPAPFACVCDSVNITGSANTSGDPFAQWTLEVQPASGGSWTQIAAGTTPVTNALLGVWSTPPTQGYYVLRLTVQNACGFVNTAIAIVLVDKQFDTIDVREPDPADIIGGNAACLDGTVWDQCFVSYTVGYRPGNSGPFTPVDPAHLSYAIPVSNDPLASWNTATGATPDGAYEIRVQGTDTCGHVGSVIIPVVIDNTAPTAVISSPLACSSVSGSVSVMGTANDAHLAGWALQYTGGNVHTWVTIASGSSPVVNGLLGTWNTAGLPPCAYTLRLLVSDRSSINCVTSNETEYTVSVNVGGVASCCDINHDGMSNGLDVQPFVNCLINGSCP